MSWKRLGRIPLPIGNANGTWASHASHPQALALDGSIHRIFFSGRDSQNRSSIFAVDWDLEKPDQILRPPTEPVFSFGQRGEFDDSGATLGHILVEQDRLRLYYLGWNLGVTVPWRNAIGLAESRSIDGPFLRSSPAPILDRNPHDPLTLSYPFVVRQNDDWQMFYGSHLKWGIGTRDMNHVIKLARGTDGMNWITDKRVVVAMDDSHEIPVSRPWIWGRPGAWDMLFCYKTETYRIGSAHSEDLSRWDVAPQAALGPGVEDWESGMQCYPSVFEYRGRTYMLYCGNDYGRTGFGWAVWEGTPQ